MQLNKITITNRPKTGEHFRGRPNRYYGVIRPGNVGNDTRKMTGVSERANASQVIEKRMVSALDRARELETTQ